MKLADFINVLRAAEFFKHEQNTNDSRLLRAAQDIAEAPPDRFSVHNDQVVIPAEYAAKFDVLHSHSLVRNRVEAEGHGRPWGALHGRPFVSTLPERSSWSQ